MFGRGRLGTRPEIWFYVNWGTKYSDCREYPSGGISSSDFENLRGPPWRPAGLAAAFRMRLNAFAYGRVALEHGGLQLGPDRCMATSLTDGSFAVFSGSRVSSLNR